ncbi:hypothetical protein EYF80_005178 [Liparis tanakae]|uniref:Uncharacterized protein n=1 Tax=Liparis tanakae TaxID=230148 RepID=A0A4Z2J461_9TELE|nr:hypothetical protein EYF80_005178 [Liparis tanakae]
MEGAATSPSAKAGGGGGILRNTSLSKGTAARGGKSGRGTHSSSAWKPSSTSSSARGAVDSVGSWRFSSLERDGSKPPKSRRSRNSVATREASFSSLSSWETSPRRDTPSSCCFCSRSISRSSRRISSIWRLSSSEVWLLDIVWDSSFCKRTRREESAMEGSGQLASVMFLQDDGGEAQPQEDASPVPLLQGLLQEHLRVEQRHGRAGATETGGHREEGGGGLQKEGPPGMCRAPVVVCWQHPVPTAEEAAVPVRLAAERLSLTAARSGAERGAAAEPHGVRAASLDGSLLRLRLRCVSTTDAHRQRGSAEWREVFKGPTDGEPSPADLHSLKHPRVSQLVQDHIRIKLDELRHGWFHLDARQSYQISRASAKLLQLEWPTVTSDLRQSVSGEARPGRTERDRPLAGPSLPGHQP